MSNLFWFQSWYVKHSFDAKIDVSIETNKERGWQVSINLQDTKYNQLPGYSFESEFTGLDWYKIELKNQLFIASGNFTQLDFLIGKFRDLIGETDYEKKRQDNYWDADIQGFIFEKNKELITFSHYTSTKEIADQILLTGFRFYDFDKSAHEAKSQSTELNYFHYLHKQFGNFIVVISISRKLYYEYLNEINSINSSVSRVEEILSEVPTFLNENSDEVYTLHKKFIKGYLNYYSKEIVRNPDFDPYYDSEQFKINIKNSITG